MPHSFNLYSSPSDKTGTNQPELFKHKSEQSNHRYRASPQDSAHYADPLHPPPPPLRLTPYVAVSSTDQTVLWYIAKNVPDLRCWVIANPRAKPDLLEYISQSGGPHVKDCFTVLFAALDADEDRPIED